MITNPYGSVTSAPATVTISMGNVAPTITGLTDQSVIQGQDAAFAPSVAGVPTPWVQWYKNGVPIPGANSATLTIYNCQYPADDALYSLVATNVAGTASNAARLTVIVPPTIVAQPRSTTAPVGAPASFTVSVNANPAPSYQWYKGSDAIPNATNATLAFAAVQPADAGVYKVFVANPGGAAWSAPATLTVTSTSVAWTNLTPNGVSGVCLDTLLRVRFNSASVALGTGALRIYDAEGNLVETVDLSLNDVNNAQIRSIGGANYYAYPVIIRGNVATIYPRGGVLTSNKTYYVLMDTGFFKDGTGASIVGVTDTNAWRFTTKVALPDPYATTNVVVAADGMGDFATVQGAIDWIPANAQLPYTVQIRKGVYEEINRIPAGKNNITFVGEGWRETVITYANNNAFQLSLAGTATRCMFFAGGNDLVFKNITFTNSTPQGGSQAEAMRVQGVRIMFDNCTFCSYQDTILINTANSSSGLFNKCLVQGDVDFIWGSGIGFFTNCEIRAMQRANNAAGIYTQPRTPESTYGFIFVDSLLSCSAPGMTNWSLARDAGNSYPYGNVAWINCRMDSHISPAGWADGGLTDKSTLRFWEYKSTDLTGTNLIPTNQRVWWSRQLQDWEAAMLRDAATVFAPVSWTPTLAAYVASPPTNQTIYAGQTLVIAAAVGGLPEPVCQWFRNGVPIPGATNAVLIIPNAQTNATGSYFICVTNAYGYDTSPAAAVVVLPSIRPTIGKPVVLQNGTVKLTLTGTPGVQYRLWATTNVTLAPITSTWTLLRSGTFSSTPIEIEDTDAPNYRQRFYTLTTP
ncbi:MAG: pectinesterase family protein [Verrucomicrobiales bacterium]|nr:pectinesterase family protein [Verrucomicrobiales bacterium]